MSTNLIKGTYRVRGKDPTLGLASTGTEQVGVLLEILDDDFQGEHMPWYGYFTDATTERTLESLRHLGWEGDDLLDLSTVGSKEAFAVLDDEDDGNGGVRLRVKWINGSNGMAMKNPMNEAQRQAFAAKMKGKIIAQRQKTQGRAGAGSSQQRQPAGRTPPSQPRHSPAQQQQPSAWDGQGNPPNDDDIPF